MTLARGSLSSGSPTGPCLCAAPCTRVQWGGGGDAGDGPASGEDIPRGWAGAWALGVAGSTGWGPSAAGASLEAAFFSFRLHGHFTLP